MAYYPFLWTSLQSRISIVCFASSLVSSSLQQYNTLRQCMSMLGGAQYTITLLYVLLGKSRSGEQGRRS